MTIPFRTFKNFLEPLFDDWVGRVVDANVKNKEPFSINKTDQFETIISVEPTNINEPGIRVHTMCSWDGTAFHADSVTFSYEYKQMGNGSMEYIADPGWAESSCHSPIGSITLFGLEWHDHCMDIEEIRIDRAVAGIVHGEKWGFIHYPRTRLPDQITVHDVTIYDQDNVKYGEVELHNLRDMTSNGPPVFALDPLILPKQCRIDPFSFNLFLDVKSELAYLIANS